MKYILPLYRMPAEAEHQAQRIISKYNSLQLNMSPPQGPGGEVGVMFIRCLCC